MTEKKKILITDRFSQEAFLTLQHQSFLQISKSDTPDLRQLDVSEINGVITRSRTVIDEAFFARAKKLQVVISATSGFDHIDLKAAEKWGVTVMFTPDANIESATQQTWALALACSNKIVQAHKALKAGIWDRDAVTGFELNKKTYGVVGLGRIGRRVSEIAQAFGMNVIAYDPYCEESQFRGASVERVAYEEILKTADILSFHVPLTTETHHMLNRSHFEYIHRGIILLNTSRGSVIHEADLCEAIEQGWVGAVGLDVFEKEPLPRSSKLLNHPQVIVTPHCGGNTFDAFAKASEMAALKMIRFFVDGSTSDTLPPKAAWYGALPPWKKD